MTQDRVPSALDGERIDRVVAMVTGCSRGEAADLVGRGLVLVDGAPVTKSSVRVREGAELNVTAQPSPAEISVTGDPSIDLAVVHEDAEVVVIDKPAGLVVHPGSGNRSGTLVNALVARYPEITTVGDPGRPGIVHRLDKDTSGLLMVARTQDAHAALVRQLAARTVERRYLALVWGRPDAPRGLIDAPIGRSNREPTRMSVSARGRDAGTSYELVTAYADPAVVTLVRCRLETGRTHQIRVHLAAIGHPVVGDARYGGRRQPLTDVGRFFLHAERLGFAHPTTGDTLSFDSPLPPDLERVLDRLR